MIGRARPTSLLHVAVAVNSFDVTPFADPALLLADG